MNRIFTILFLCAMFTSGYAQKIVYLDNHHYPVKDRSTAKEYAVITDDKKAKCEQVAFFSMDNQLKETCSYLKFNKNPKDRVRHGRACYKYAGSEQDSMVCYYNKNVRTGGCMFFYPDGKTKVECVFHEGSLNGALNEFYPNGTIKRKDMYKAGVATHSQLFSEEGEFMGISPFYVGPQTDFDYNTLIKLLGYNIQMPESLMKKEGDWKIIIEVTFDENGKIEDICSLRTNNIDLIDPIIKQVEEVFRQYEFTPATMDHQPVRGSFIFPLTFKVKSVMTNKSIDNI